MPEKFWKTTLKNQSPSLHFQKEGKRFAKNMKKGIRKGRKEVRKQKLQKMLFVLVWRYKNRNWRECIHKEKALHRECMKRFPLAVLKDMSKRGGFRW